MRHLRVLLVLVLLCAAGAAALATVERWYQPWMPASVGRLGFPLEHVAAVRAGAERNRLDPALVAAVIYTESGFDQHVRSSQGAVGLMQVLPSTAREIARQSGGAAFAVSDLATPRINVLYGCFYLRRLLDRFEGSLVEALAAYNAGAARVEGWRTAAGGQLAVADIPYEETRSYVEQVLHLRAIYAHVYGSRLAGGSSEIVGCPGSTDLRERLYEHVFVRVN